MAPLCFLLSECKGRHFKFTVQLFCRFLCKISANNQQSPRKPTKKASFWERHAQEGGTIKVVYQNASNSYLLFGRILQGFPSALFIPPLFIRFARCALVRRSCLVTSSFYWRYVYMTRRRAESKKRKLVFLAVFKRFPLCFAAHKHFQSNFFLYLDKFFTKTCTYYEKSDYLCTRFWEISHPAIGM